MVCIYVLKLEKGKYYIGKTNNIEFRLENHFNGDGSEWTKLFKPLELLEFKQNCDDYDEDKITIQYMNKYGINNVRGGSFVSIKLKDSQIETLNTMINGSNDKCFRCGESGHFSKDCEESDFEEVWLCEYCEKEFDDENKCEYHEKYCKSKNKIICFRCGREGHYSNECYASRHIRGYKLYY